MARHSCVVSVCALTELEAWRTISNKCILFEKDIYWSYIVSIEGYSINRYTRSWHFWSWTCWLEWAEHFLWSMKLLSKINDIEQYVVKLLLIVWSASLRPSIDLYWCSGPPRLPSQTQAETVVHVESWCRCRTKTSARPSQTRTLSLWWQRQIRSRGGKPGSSRTQPATRHQQNQWVLDQFWNRTWSPSH